jgi:hypothetical protein
LTPNVIIFRKVFPGIFPRVLTLKQFYWLPAVREFILSNGGCAASKQGIEALLR